MGASTFQEHSRNLDVQKAYTELVDSAAFEDGHSAYSGTIATTNGFSVVSDTLLTPVQADEMMAQRIAKLSKWGACEAVRVGTPKKTKTRTVVVKGITEVATARDAAATLGVDLSQIVSVKRVSHSVKHDFAMTGAPLKEWVWEDGYRKRGVFPSKSEALKALKSAMKEDSWPRGEEKHHIYQRAASTVVTCTVKEVVTKLEVVLVAGPLEFSSWCFYGWAAS